MREIKFRGKALRNGQWVEGYYVRFRDYPVIVPEHIDGFNIHWNQVDPATVGQFTGLKDKNGVEIWEGDIVRDSEGIGVVRFKVPGFIVCDKDCDEFWLGAGMGYPQDQNTLSATEVVGNIYDTREPIDPAETGGKE